MRDRVVHSFDEADLDLVWKVIESARPQPDSGPSMALKPQESKT